MEDFKFVMDLAPENVTFDDLPLTVGTKVQVVKGEFCGIEGELSSLANRTLRSDSYPRSSFCQRQSTPKVTFVFFQRNS